MLITQRPPFKKNKDVSKPATMLQTTRAGLSLNPLLQYNYTGGTPDGNNVLNTYGGMAFIGSDSATFEYDFYTKIGGSVADCPLRLYEGNVDLNNIFRGAINYTNLMLNANFATDSNADGLADGWQSNSTGWSCSGNVQSYMPTAQYNNVSQSFTTGRAVGDKMYVCAMVKASYYNVILQANNNGTYNGIQYGDSSNTWRKLSLYFSANAVNELISIQHNGTSGFAQVQVKEVMYINLTALFGAGNEPTKEWCDSNLTFTATSNTVANTSNWVEITSQSKLDRLKAQNYTPISSTANASDFTLTYNSVNYDDVAVHIKDDFTGKITSSTVENPNIAKSNGNGATDTTLRLPSEFASEFYTDGGYSLVSSQNGSSVTTSTTNNGAISQQLYAWNIIRIVEDKFGEIPVTTTAEKITWLNNNLSKINFSCFMFGSCPTGNYAVLKPKWSGGWGSGWNNTSSSPTQIIGSVVSSSIASNGFIDSTGFCYVLATTNASNGTIASSISVDYISIELVFKCPNGYGSTNPMTSNFVGKVRGSITENPNIYRYSHGASLVSPTGGTEVASQVNYDNIISLNGTCDNNGWSSVAGDIPQQLFLFDLVKIVEAKLGYSIPATDKIAWLNANVYSLQYKWHGYGTYNNGANAFAKVAWWKGASSAWSSGISHTNSTVTLITTVLDNANIVSNSHIGSDGMCAILATATTANGNVSAVYTDYVELIVTLKSNRILVPSSNRRDGDKGELLVANEQDYAVTKLFDSTSIGISASVSNKAKAMMLEIDLTPLANNLSGGSINAFRNLLNGITVDVHAKATGSYNGLSANYATTRYWSAGIYNAWSSTTVNNTTGAISKMTNTRDSALTRTSLADTGKIYLVAHSNYASDGTIPSTLDIDYVNVKVTVAKTADIPNTIPVALPSTWTCIVKGFSPTWDSSLRIEKRLLEFYKDSGNRILTSYHNTGAWSYFSIIGGVQQAYTINPSAFGKNTAINFAVVYNGSDSKLVYLPNNGTKNTMSAPFTNTTALGNVPMRTLYSQDSGGTKQADGLFQSVHFIPKILTDNELDIILKGRNEVDVSNSYYNNLANKYANPNILPSFNSGQWTLTGSTSSADGNTLTLTSGGSWVDGGIIIVPVLPNNRYELKVTMTGNARVGIDERTNNVTTKVDSVFGYSTSSKTIVTSPYTTALRVKFSNGSSGAGTYTFSNVELRRKD